MTIERVEFLRYQRILSAALDKQYRLTSFENEFVEDWIERLEKRGTEVIVTERQSVVFDRLERKLNA